MEKFAQIISAAILIIILSNSVDSTDYCAADLCKGRKHVACGNNGSFGAACAADAEIVDLTSFKDQIVANHNEFRNKIASGAMMPQYRPANRMSTMVWDDELARMAELNVRTCVFAHDKCRNTDSFKFSGQNLFMAWSKPNPMPVSRIVKDMTTGWFNEFKDASQMNIDKYQSSKAMIGHFTVMVADKNRAVGCAVVRFSRDGGTEFHIACNYAYTNILNFPIYKAGLAASKCQTGVNPKYPALCSEKENNDPNNPWV